MAAQHGGAAGGDGVQGTALSAREHVRALIRRAVRADDIRELEVRRALDGEPRGGRRRDGHGSERGRRGQIQRRAGVEHAALREVEVAGGGREMTVAEELLDPRQIAAAFE